MRSRRDHTALSCVAIVAIAATLNVGKIIPVERDTPRVATSWWDVSCQFFPWASWCPEKVQDPPIKTLAPDTPDGGVCGDGTFIGPCNQ